MPSYTYYNKWNAALNSTFLYIALLFTSWSKSSNLTNQKRF